MIIVLKREIKREQKEGLSQFLEEKGFKVREIVGEEETVLGAVGLSPIDPRTIELMPGVERVIPISKPYKLASREFKQEDTIVTVGPARFGGNRVAVIAGPCAVESRDQIREAAWKVRESGAVMLRGGAFKPRTSPYSFQGHGEKGLIWLKEAGEETGLPVATEVVAAEHVPLMRDYADVLQVGARNMQNFELLKKVGALGKPVIIKRGLSARIEEWLMAAEYLLAHGAENVILCERGIRTFETYTRNTLDLSAIPIVKKLSHLPVIVDPSHGTGLRGKVLPMALAGVAAGADGLMIEVHPRPDEALSDGPQSLFPDQFEKLMRDIEALSPVIGKEIEKPLTLKTKSAGSAGAGVTPAGGEGKSCVAFQGEKGAYSESALHRYFGPEQTVSRPYPRFYDVFDAVLKGETDYGIVPIENSLAGSIHENYDLLLQFEDLKIVGEKEIRITHNLIGIPGATLEGIREVYSHPQGLAQCAAFLDGHSGIRRIPAGDTAGSVAFIAREGRRELGAIAGKEAAESYGMEILKEGIETNPRNYTRFFILARTETPEPEGARKAAVVFSLADKSGSLYELLGILTRYQLNMKKLESRPILGKPWQYMFYVEFEYESRENLDAAAAELKAAAEDFRVLGLFAPSR